MSEVERALGDGIADDRLTTADADVLREFGAFLSEVGPVGRPVPVETLRKYKDLLGLTEEEIADLERRLAAVAGHPAGQEVGA